MRGVSKQGADCSSATSDASCDIGLPESHRVNEAIRRQPQAFHRRQRGIELGESVRIHGLCPQFAERVFNAAPSDSSRTARLPSSMARSITDMADSGRLENNLRTCWLVNNAFQL